MTRMEKPMLFQTPSHTEFFIIFFFLELTLVLCTFVQING